MFEYFNFVFQITISPALLQQATALHRSQTKSTNATSKVVSLDISQVRICTEEITR